MFKQNREEDLQNRLNEAESSRNKLIFEIENNSKQSVSLLVLRDPNV